ncbi:MAG: hypothetical protein RMJ97_09555 [Raineya sp.]|nr:hypothetical protein [Raineya sp.]MDW8297111.1 hypothetical protein [Raineya sp.]
MNNDNFAKALDALKDIFDEKCWVGFPTNQKFTKIDLKEDGNKAELRKVSISGFEINTVGVIKLDIEAGRTICKYFSKSTEKPINRSCDYVIFAKFEEQNYLLFVEMKSEILKGYKDQFRNSMIFMEYVCRILQEYYEVDISFKKKLLLLYYKKSNNKQAINEYYSSKQTGNKINETSIRKIGFRNANNQITIRELIKKS